MTVLRRCEATERVEFEADAIDAACIRDYTRGSPVEIGNLIAMALIAYAKQHPNKFPGIVQLATLRLSQ